MQIEIANFNSCDNINNKKYILNFRMAFNNKTLNATCDLDGYLFCRMPGDTLEVEIKVKNKMGKVHQVSRHLYPHWKSSAPGIGQIGEAACTLGEENTLKGGT